MQRDLVDFLILEFRLRPGMYLGEYSLSRLPIFTAGFMVATNFYDAGKSGMNRFDKFIEWFEKKHSIERCSSWTWPFLKMANFDEKASFDLFISELEEYLLDTEGYKI